MSIARAAARHVTRDSSLWFRKTVRNSGTCRREQRDDVFASAVLLAKRLGT